MDVQLAILCGLTFVIHLIGTLAYAVRIAGVRTRRIAVSFALFNFFGSLLIAVGLFFALLGSARVAAQADPQILRILLNSNRFAVRYDPAKWSPIEVEGGGNEGGFASDPE